MDNNPKTHSTRPRSSSISDAPTGNIEPINMSRSMSDEIKSQFNSLGIKRRNPSLDLETSNPNVRSFTTAAIPGRRKVTVRKTESETQTGSAPTVETVTATLKMMSTADNVTSGYNVPHETKPFFKRRKVAVKKPEKTEGSSDFPSRTKTSISPSPQSIFEQLENALREINNQQSDEKLAGANTL